MFTGNCWWGKLIGAGLGYLVAGPAGALFGILIGNFFDKGLESYFSNPHFHFHSEKRQAVQKIFFEATFSILGLIAKADGYVSAQEIQMAKRLMSEMKLNKQQKDLAKRLFNEGKLPTFKLDQVLTQLKSACRDNRELLKLFIDIQYRASQIDGLSQKKIKALDSIFARLGFAPLHKQYRFYEDFGSASASPNSDSTEQASANQSKRQQKGQQQSSYRTQSTQSYLGHAYALLEIDPSTNKQDTKKAYRRLLSRNHPDKLIAQGLPEAMIKMANEKTHKIVKAYELICQSKGWPQ
jgi:DnaJ like chaperone protein